MVSKLILLATVLSSVAPAGEWNWFKLVPHLNYRDLAVNCTSDGYLVHYLAVQSQGTGVTAALVRAGGTESYHPSATFSQEELKGIKLEKDEYERRWLSELTLGARLLRWLLENSKSGLDACGPSTPLQTIEPAEFSFVFDRKELATGPVTLSSSLGKFSGKKKNGRAYQAGLFLIQERY